MHNESKEAWKTINEVISTGKVNERSNLVCLENSSGGQQSVADAFAEYFAGIGQKLAGNIPSTPHDAEIVLDTVDWNEHSIFLSPVTQEEILSLINSVQSLLGLKFILR